MTGKINSKAFKKILKREPERIVKYLENPDKEIRGAQLNSLWKLLTKYEYNQIPQLFVKNIMDTVDTDEIKKIKKDHFRILAFFLNNVEYMEKVKRYIPDHKEKIEDANFLSGQEAAIRNLRYVNDLSETIEFMLNFSEGNFLSYSLPALYSAAHHIKEEKLRNLLKVLITKAVSVRKHAIHMANSYTEVEYRHQLLFR